MPCAVNRALDLEGFVVDPHAVEWAEFREHYPRCPDCSRAVSRLGALAAALGSEGSAGSAHATSEELLALSTSPEQLRREQRERVELHLTSCAPCRTELAVLARFDFSALEVAATAPRPRARLLLAAAIAGLLAVPAVLLWWALSAEETRVAHVEPELRPPAAPSEVRPPPAPAPVPTPAPAPAPAPSAIAKPPPAPPAPAAEKPPAPAPAPPRPLQIAALIPSEAPLYASPGGGSVRIGGASRSAGNGPALEALAPETIGRTLRESPTLYFFLPEATALSVEVSIVDPNGVDPLFEATLPGPLAAGFHTLPLAERGVRLAPGVNYQWFVAVVVDPARRARDLVSGGSIRYAPEAAPQPAGAPEQRAHAYAAAGLWYDAFDQLSTWLAAEPNAAILHAHRAALLEQVDLGGVARYERGAASRAE